MYLQITDNKYRCRIPKNDRIALKLKPGDMIEVNVIRVIPAKEDEKGDTDA